MPVLLLLLMLLLLLSLLLLLLLISKQVVATLQLATSKTFRPIFVFCLDRRILAVELGRRCPPSPRRWTSSSSAASLSSRRHLKSLNLAPICRAKSIPKARRYLKQNLRHFMKWTVPFLFMLLGTLLSIESAAQISCSKKLQMTILNNKTLASFIAKLYNLMDCLNNDHFWHQCNYFKNVLLLKRLYCHCKTRSLNIFIVKTPVVSRDDYSRCPINQGIAWKSEVYLDIDHQLSLYIELFSHKNDLFWSYLFMCCKNAQQRLETDIFAVKVA